MHLAKRRVRRRTELEGMWQEYRINAIGRNAEPPRTDNSAQALFRPDIDRATTPRADIVQKISRGTPATDLQQMITEHLLPDLCDKRALLRQ